MPLHVRGWITFAVALVYCASADAALELSASAPAKLIEQVHALPGDSQTPPAGDASWRVTALPDRWSKSHGDQVGSVWYRLALAVEAPAPSAWAVMLPKVSMNADIWLNGELAGRTGSMDGRLTRHWNTPLLFQIPHELWNPGENTLHVRVKAEAGQDGGLGRFWIGQTSELEPMYDARALWQIKLLLIADISVFALGIFFLFIWLRERDQVHYGYFAFGTFFWGIANTNMALTEPPLPDLAWEWLAHVTLIWGLCLLGLFGLRFAGKRLLRMELAVAAFGLFAAVLLAVVPEHWRVRADAALLLPVIAVGASGLIAVARKMGRRPLHDYVLFSIAGAATIFMGGHDWFLKAGYLPYDRAYVLPFLAPILLGAMAWLVAGEFVRAQRNLAQLNQDLGTRVEERERQLRDSYQRLSESESERAVIAERARILRDMHDGVGSHLSAAIRQIEAGGAASVEVAQTLRDSLDQLKLSVDAMNLPPGDVNALLAAIRYRLQPRIHAAKLSLEWEVDELPPWSAGDGAAMRHLQYMLFETFSNALQHAQARGLRLSARVDMARIVVALHDDGLGFQVPPELALRSLRERAQLIGAEVSVETGATGSCVRLALPLAGAAAH